MSASRKDRIYLQRPSHPGDFVFDEAVAEVFEDMITRSVPGYESVLRLVQVVARKFVTKDSSVYDLGCSLGAASFSVCQAIPHAGVNVIAVDNSKAMIGRLQQRLKEMPMDAQIRPVCADLIEVEIQNASLVILNYTLQFVDPARRDSLIQKIYSGLQQDAALLLSEKIRYPDHDEDALMQSLHESFKQGQHYSALEITRKREALENVLIRDTHEQHRARLYRAGFSRVYVLMQHLNFITYIAIK